MRLYSGVDPLPEIGDLALEHRRVLDAHDVALKGGRHDLDAPREQVPVTLCGLEMETGVS